MNAALLLPKRLNTFLLIAKTLCQIKKKQIKLFVIFHAAATSVYTNYTYIHTHIHTYTHTYIHTYIYTYISLCPTPGEGSTLDM